MIYLGRAIVRPFPDLIDFVAFDHAKWALVVNNIYRDLKRELELSQDLDLFSVNIDAIF